MVFRDFTVAVATVLLGACCGAVLLLTTSALGKIVLIYFRGSRTRV